MSSNPSPLPQRFDPAFDVENHKRCIECKTYKPLREFATKRVRVCFTCRGLMLRPDWQVVALPPPKPKPRHRAIEAAYPLEYWPAYQRYMRELNQRLRAEKRARDGHPPRQPPAHGGTCPKCARFLPRENFTGLNRICDECLATELADIEAYSRSKQT